MTKKLVIVESPAKARTLSKILGKGYDLKASAGHVRDLPKSQLGVDIEHNYEPKYITLRNKGKVITELKKAASAAKEVYLATDPDREGEAIAWHLLAITGAEKKYKRVTFHEITEEAINKAFAEPRKLDMNLVDAQQARRVLDRLVGYKLSPLLWRKVKRGLSAGRVQSVAVRIIVDREREIRAFIPKEYWNIDALLYSRDPDTSFKASFHGTTSEKLDINDAKEAEIIKKELESSDYHVKKLTKKDSIRRAQPPFTTSTMQQEAWRKLRFSAKQTMAIAQQLYEGLPIGDEGEVGLITYMRTDSVKVAKSAIAEARDMIKEKYGAQYIPEKPQYYGTKSRGAQEAHEAIRPTRLWREPTSIKKYLKPDQFKLYKLIWERMVASQMSNAVYDVTSLDICAVAKSKKKYILKSQSSMLRFKGFLVLYSTEESENEQADNSCGDISEGAALNLKEVTAEQNFTKPPARYTEGTLIRTLESDGIGRPSTYAPIISTIVDREYVVKDNGVFKPTELGEAVNDLLVNNFPTVFDIDFTAKMEDSLDDVAEGQRNWVELISNFYPPFEAQLEKATEEVQHVKLTDPEVEEKCPNCGKNLVIKSGRFGKFLACPDYPDCKFTKSYQLSTGIACPKCKTGEIVEKKSHKGKTFWGCSNYPQCDYVLFNKPVKSPACTECGSILTEFKGKQLRCSSCGHIQKAKP